MNGLEQRPAATGVGSLGACAQCGQPAAGARVFCGGCGARLWDPCIDCGVANNVAEGFCRECGVDLNERLAAVQGVIDEQLATAERFEQQGDLLNAFESLADVRESDHSQLTSRIERVRQRREELSSRRLRAIAERGARLEDARRLHQEKRFAQAWAVLEQVPAALRDQETRRLLDELAKPLAEIKRARAALAEALKTGNVDGGLRTADRLVELEPHADDLRHVWQQLHLQRQQRDAVLSKKLLAKARGAIASNDYATAQRCLERMPPRENENDRKLLIAIEERVWLVQQIRSQPFADHQLLRLAERLTKLQPKDANAGKVYAEIGARLSRGGKRTGRPFVPWGRAAGGTRFGAPFEPVFDLANVHWDARRPELAPWASGLRRYLVAFGLALSGLGEASLHDLSFRLGASSWLNRFTSARRRAARAAWGLDFGSSGLKVVRLTCEKDVVTVDRSACIPYATDQPRSQATQIQPFLAAAFQQFETQCSPGDERLVISFPGAQTLGRFFELPPMKAGKLQKAVAFEVGNQIPLPVDEVVSAVHLWTPLGSSRANAKANAKSATHQQVAAVAAKKSHVDLRAGLLADRGARGGMLESECVALLNALLHCRGEQISQLKPDESIVLVEIGDSATNVVAVSPARGPWFRTIHRGIRALNRPLVEALGITWQKADQLRQQWPGGQPMATIDRALAPAIDELSRDLEHALRAYHDSHATRVVRIFVAGGGCDQFGLLRAWSANSAAVQPSVDPSQEGGARADLAELQKGDEPC